VENSEAKTNLDIPIPTSALFGSPPTAETLVTTNNTICTYRSRV
jgi:hypothetical protein